ncbi:hypothetical protein BKA64DRAFT_148333 [Cadophora sp. MPI-SDFR-AT-0126]|nr:hypothetical protein BKA64DRAFT_148333 [Leotiomycetes sp. MPI-SDFR-AT-0126]
MRRGISLFCYFRHVARRFEDLHLPFPYRESDWPASPISTPSPRPPSSFSLFSLRPQPRILPIPIQPPRTADLVRDTLCFPTSAVDPSQHAISAVMSRRSARIAERASLTQDLAASLVPRPPPTFRPFPRLPLEIRQMIWNLSLEPRVIEMEYEEEQGFFTTCSLPSALQVCQESRSTVKKLYPECFASLWHRRGPLFNFSLDTLYIAHHFFEDMILFLSVLREKEINSLRYLAVEADHFEYGCSCGECHNPLQGHDNFERFKVVINSLVSLEEITIVYALEAELGFETEKLGWRWYSDATEKSSAMRLMDDVPAEIMASGIHGSLGTPDWCDSFDFLTSCKCRHVYGWRKFRRVEIPTEAPKKKRKAN